MAWRELRIYGSLSGRDLLSAPGQEQSVIPPHPDAESQHGRQYHSQQARKVIDGVPRSSLPEIVIKGCPHCKGDLCKEHVDFGYGDYACKDCGRAWDVSKVRREGGRLHLEFGRVGHYLEQKPPKRRRRSSYDYD